MKRILALLLVFCLAALPACAGAEEWPSRLDVSATLAYSEAWNRFFQENGIPHALQPAGSVAGQWFRFGYETEEADKGTYTTREWLAASTLPWQARLIYDSETDCFLLGTSRSTLTDEPLSLELYAGSSSWPVRIEQLPADGDIDDSRLLYLPFEGAEACLLEKNGFLRIVTDQGTCFLELNENEAPALCAMLARLYAGLCFSDPQSGSYLSPGLLPQAASAAGSAPEAASPGTPFQNDYEAIAAAARSVFLLEAYDENDTLFSYGSGFLAFDSRTMITNHHVIDGAAYLIAHSDNYEASYRLTELKAVHEERDIAILRFGSEGSSSPPLPLDCNSRLLRGQPVTAIGSPKGVLNTVSGGNISNIVPYSDALPEAIQFTAAASPGSSGGALFNENGHVIGLVFSEMLGAENMNYAIPIRYVADLHRESAGKAPVPLMVYNGLLPQLPAASMQAPRAVDGGILLTWTKVEGAKEYRVYRKQSGDTDFRQIAATGKASCTDTTATPGQSYTYRVEAVSSQLLTSLSNQVSFTVPEPTPTPAPKPTPVPQGQILLEIGDSGEEVLALRLKLYELGYLAEKWLDRQQYDQSLVSAVLSLQRSNGLTPSGVLDGTTLALLDSGKAARGTLTVPKGLQALSRRHYREGDTGSDVKKLKAQLQAQGYYRPDAAYGDDYNATMTERVKQLQKNNGLAQTGILDHRTLAKLYAADCKKGKWK